MSRLAGLNPQQRAAVETIRGPVLILAGAGTGKTRVITHRVAHLVASGVPPEHILAVTFTNKAAREMLGRVRELLPAARRGGSGAAPRPTICTFHSLGVRILRRHIERLGYQKNFTIYDEAEQVGVIQRLLSRIVSRGEKPDPRVVLGLLSRLRNAAGGSAAVRDEAAAEFAAQLRARYESALRAANAVDFDDLILLTLRLFREHPEALAACRDQYRYLMVDEYQDTNAAQFELVHALAREHRNLCVVGDDDQSIYGWRGAEIANLLDLERHLPEVKIITLEQNYRSTNVILRAANAVIRNNVRRRGKQLWSGRGEGARIRILAFDTDEDEARAVAEEIELARCTGRAPWREHAVLFRTNHQSRPLEAALRRLGVRYRLIGGQSFFDRLEVRDLLAYLRLCANPADDASLLRIANVPARGLSDATLERLLAAGAERHCSILAAMRHTDVQAAFPPRAREAIAAFVALIEDARARLADPATACAPRALAAWADLLISAAGYFDHLRRVEKDPETAGNRARNVRDLIATLDGDASPESDLAARREVRPSGLTEGSGSSDPLTVGGLESPPSTVRPEGLTSSGRPAAEPLPTRLDRVLAGFALDGERAEDDTETPGDAVTLITMHSCKGLEFPRVFVAGLEDGLLPHSRSKEEGTLDEERRLFYVAITRAMHTLALSHCAGRRRYGQVMPCHPSPFLKELPPELVVIEQPRDRQPVGEAESGRLFALVREAAAAKGAPASHPPGAARSPVV